MKEILKKIFSDYPGRFVIMMQYLKNDHEIFFSEMDKTLNGEVTSIPDFFWIRQCHCLLLKLQEGLCFSKKKIEKQKKNIVQFLQLSLMNNYEEEILSFQSKLIEYCDKGEDLWEKLAEEGLMQSDIEKFHLCYKNRKLYEAEKREIEKGILNHPYFRLFSDYRNYGNDDSLKQFAHIWEKYYHPINGGYVESYKRLLQSHPA